MVIFVRLLMLFVGGGLGATLLAQLMWEVIDGQEGGPHFRLSGMAIGAAAGLFVARFIAPSNTSTPNG